MGGRANRRCELRGNVSNLREAGVSHEDAWQRSAISAYVSGAMTAALTKRFRVVPRHVEARRGGRASGP